MMLTNLAAIARRTGYPVVELPGWKTRGHGPMTAVEGVTCHHTANGGATGDYPSLRVVRDGRTGLPGPLAHYGIGVSGTIYVIAAGLCYHAGVSLRPTYVNSRRIGIEAEAVGVPGTKKDWPPKQMESYVRLCRALVEEFPGVEVGDVLGHKETCAPVGRKSDPSFVMRDFRNQVAATPKPPTEDIVATKAELRALLIELIQNEPLVPNKVLDAGAKPGAPWTLSGALAAGDQKADLTRREQVRQAGVLDEVTKALAGKASTASVEALSKKIDALIKLLTPKP